MDENQAKEFLRQIPGVDALLQMEAVQNALSRHPRKLVLDAIREELDETRKRILQPRRVFPRNRSAGARPPDSAARGPARRFHPAPGRKRNRNRHSHKPRPLHSLRRCRRETSDGLRRLQQPRIRPRIGRTGLQICSRRGDPSRTDRRRGRPGR